MPQHQMGGIEASGITARNRSTAGSVGVSTGVYTTPANYASVTTLDARLTVINAAMYTAAVLDKMSINDKIYAVRLNDDLATL